MNEQQNNQPPCPPAEQVPAMPPAAPVKEKRVYSAAERILLPLALVVAVLFDRLLFMPLYSYELHHIVRLSSAFWLCYLVIFYAYYWKRIKHNRVLWYVAGCSAALCLWGFFYMHPLYRYRGQISDYYVEGSYLVGMTNEEFSFLTYMVVPAVLMAHAQFFAGGYGLKDTGKMAVSWLLGWVMKPFSGIIHCFGTIGALISGGNKPVLKKAVIGVVVTLPLLGVIIPLLSGADLMFGYHLGRIVGDWRLDSFVGHTVVVAIAFMLFYSFLWNAGFGKKDEVHIKVTVQIDTVISYIVLGAVTLLYVLFCGVQFTYLFAGAGLPDGMTYSEYAREGFAQTVTVCAINLGIFGIFLAHGKRGKAITGLLIGLLGLTGIMLVSGAVRLWLYIDAYGLTWLRVLSAWFVVYLFSVMFICGVRIVKEKLPAIALCAMLLLGWFVVLGYSNPDALVKSYNQTYKNDTVQSLGSY